MAEKTCFGQLIEQVSTQSLKLLEILVTYVLSATNSLLSLQLIALS